MSRSSFRRCACTVVIGLAAVLPVGCAQHRTSPGAGPSIGLPAGNLEPLVVQPAEAPTGLVPLLRGATGPADASEIAKFSSDPIAAQRSLQAHGFVQAYIAEYADPAHGTTLVVVVTQFTSTTGATADLTADLSVPPGKGGAVLSLAPLGEQSGALRQPRPNAPVGAQLVTVRFRLGRLTFLVAVGARGAVDAQAVQRIAAQLATRATTSPLND